MDSEKQPRYPIASPEVPCPVTSTRVINLGESLAQSPMLGRTETLSSTASVVDGDSTAEILQCLHAGQVWMVNSKQRNGLILYKPFHAEFAGPGSAIGGDVDRDCQRIIPVGKLSLVSPNSHKERQDAYLIRRQWVKLIQQMTDKSVPMQRAQLILNQFETYFDQETIARIPDEAFALLVGVLPYTIRMARRTPGQLTVKVRG
ncbi:MAG: hypothetical protein IGS50_11690 [Synechococcales cyanobacterium C42_A2020_086]|jgi:hypothetical protein|nr:hypothetical protein [Synechococcales cyanobacterium M58_A2018_015]MBF2074406.1 hypothetical protein [Synechococcales cyanobacterium C42_A2020_086]